MSLYLLGPIVIILSWFIIQVPLFLSNYTHNLFGSLVNSLNQGMCQIKPFFLQKGINLIDDLILAYNFKCIVVHALIISQGKLSDSVKPCSKSKLWQVAFSTLKLCHMHIFLLSRLTSLQMSPMMSLLFFFFPLIQVGQVGSPLLP